MAFGMLEIALEGGEIRRVALEKRQMMLGRDPAADISIDDSLISRQHALLLCEPGLVRLVDVGSSNGTFVGSDRLAPRQPVSLADGTQFRVGKTVVRYVSQALTEQPLEEAGPPVEQDTASFSRAELPAEPAAGGAAQDPMTGTSMRLGEAPPSGEPPESTNGRHPHDLLPSGWSKAAETGRSTYLDYLPSIYSTDEFMGRFLLIFESILDPLERQIDALHWYLDPHITPPEFLPWLASWMGLVLSETWPEEQRRELISSAVELYQWRGTRRGLSEFIRLYTGCTPDILEPGVTEGPVDPQHAHHFIVRVHSPEPDKIDRKILQTIIETEKPAHAAYTLELVGG
jgi:phage tail-like protein